MKGQLNIEKWIKKYQDWSRINQGRNEQKNKK